MLRLPLLYPITDLRLARRKTHAAVVRALVKEGFSFLQMRDRDLNGREFYEQAEAALREAGKRGARLVVNDRVDIALMLGADGVHVGGGDIPPWEARKLLGRRFVIGYSTRSVEEALRAAGRGGMDYLAVGPVYETRTKRSGRKPLGPEAVERIARRIALPLVAIGGITPRNAGEVWEAGAASAAVISALLRGGLRGNAERFRRAAERFARRTP
jgi:thiamine-phosphate pyrophosphorylase